MSLWRLSDDDSEAFGPGTDLTLSLVAILTLMLFVIGHELADARRKQEQTQVALEGVQRRQKELVDELADARQKQEQTRVALEEVHRRQKELVEALAAAFDGDAVETAPGRFAVTTEGTGKATLLIENEVTLQRISFGEDLLFDSNDHELLASGQEVLRTFAAVLRRHLEGLREVQIQGHADSQLTSRYDSNLVLAALRALEVFELLRTKGGLDPARHLMSATSFGEYSPVARRELTRYNSKLLESHNATEGDRRLNRRIEVVLIYRPGGTSPDDSATQGK